MIEALNVVAGLLVLAALFGTVNYHWLRLPPAIGLTIVALVSSLVLLLIEATVPVIEISDDLRSILTELDFADVVLHGLLSFLLFAGALHVDFSRMRQRALAIAALATVGIVISAAVVGVGMWLAFGALGMPVPLIWCLAFGALISPTDPVAVLGVLKTARVPPSLEAKIAGESLFNDGVGLVLFLVLVGIATGSQNGPDPGYVSWLLLQEAVGGAVLGALTGGVALLAIRTVNEHNLEVIITLALVTGTYQAALALHVSGPIAVVVAGLLVGTHGRMAMSESSRAHVETFWTLVDEILNALLFLLIGLEVLILTFVESHFWAALAAVPVVLMARAVAVGVPIRLLGLFHDFTRGGTWVLVWGGLRGGVSVALALSLPASPYRDLLLTACYGVVVFSIVVQGLTIAPLARRVVPPAAELEAAG